MTKKNTKEIPISVESVDEAEKIIHEKIKQGTNTRDIVKIEFDINGISKKFNPAQIKKIKEKFDATKQDNKNQDKSILYELFENKTSLVQAVIQTGFDPKFVNQVYKEYLEMKGLTTIPIEVCDKLFHFGNKMFSPCNTYEKVLRAFDSAIDCIKELDRFYVSCSICGDVVWLSENMIKKTTQWMQQRWVCSKKCSEEKSD